MNQERWVASADPLAMIDFLAAAPVLRRRKLRLAAVAFDRVVADRAREVCGIDQHIGLMEEWAESGVKPTYFREAYAQGCFENEAQYCRDNALWCLYHRGRRTEGEMFAGCARILRDIFGDPFHRIDLPVAHVCTACGWDGTGPNRKYCGRAPSVDCKASHRWKENRPWLTRDVVANAEAVYRDRIDGVMDPLGLMALADSLHEAGCDETVSRARIYVVKDVPGRWLVRHSAPRGPGEGNVLASCLRRQDAEKWADENCRVKSWSPPEEMRDRVLKEGVGEVREPHPIPAALRSAGAKYRGFWPVDLLLGKS